MTYNGWKNWETWNVALWCDNEYAIYKDRMQCKPKTPAEVEEFVRGYYPEGTPDMKDENAFCRSAVCVDWEEIADHWKDDYEG